MARVFIAGIFHETHSFSGDTTGIEGFVIHRGKQILERRGDASQVDGFLSVAHLRQPGLVPALSALRGPSPSSPSRVFLGDFPLGPIIPATLSFTLALGCHDVLLH